MRCTDYNIFRNRFAVLTMHSDRDVPNKYVPKRQWMNLLRYQLTLFPKAYNQNARMITINENGKLNNKLDNLIYKVKVKLGFYKAV